MRIKRCCRAADRCWRRSRRRPACCASVRIRTTCRSPTAQGRASKTRSPNSSRAIWATRVAYTYALQNDKFIKHTLDAGQMRCDDGRVRRHGRGADDAALLRLDLCLRVAQARMRLALSSLTDPRLRKLKIGVHLIGDDSTPPTLALGQEGIVDNVHGYHDLRRFRQAQSAGAADRGGGEERRRCRGGLGTAGRLFREIVAGAAQRDADDGHRSDSRRCCSALPSRWACERATPRCATSSTP